MDLVSYDINLLGYGKLSTEFYLSKNLLIVLWSPISGEACEVQWSLNGADQ